MRNNGKFILDENHVARPAPLMEWAEWMQRTDRRVAVDVIGDSKVSTVFLGVDHRFFGEGPPLLFESMIFGGLFDQDQRRYSTWEEAVAGHAEMVAKARSALN